MHNTNISLQQVESIYTKYNEHMHITNISLQQFEYKILH